MNPQEKQEFEQMKQELRELRQWKQAREQQLINLSIDEASLGVLNQGYYGFKFDRITAKELRYDTLTAL